MSLQTEDDKENTQIQSSQPIFIPPIPLPYIPTAPGFTMTPITHNPVNHVPYFPVVSIPSTHPQNQPLRSVFANEDDFRQNDNNNLEFVFDVTQNNYLMQSHVFCPPIAQNNIININNVINNKSTIINVNDVFDIKQESASSDDTEDFEAKIKEEAITDDSDESINGSIDTTKRGKKRKRTLDDDYEAIQFESPRKKRKLSDGDTQEIASMTNKELDEYIVETVSKKECMNEFNRYLKNGKVIIPISNADASKNKLLHHCNINECGKSYRSKCHLKRHIDEIHTGKKYLCAVDDCLASFKQKSQAREHLRNSHFGTDGDWHCYICQEEFTRWGGVKRHLEKKRCRWIKKKILSQEEIDEILLETKYDLNRDRCRGKEKGH